MTVLLRPFPWEVSSKLQILASLEGIALAGLLTPARAQTTGAVTANLTATTTVTVQTETIRKFSDLADTSEKTAGEAQEPLSQNWLLRIGIYCQNGDQE